MNEEQIEARSLLDLAAMMREAGKRGIRLVLIGGYAVAAYTRGYRYTKDVDLVADKPTTGKLTGLMTSLDYRIRNTEFGLAGSKRLNGGFVDLHISIGKIHDISTGNDYPIDASFFKSARRLVVRGFYSKTSELRLPVVDLETLLILKLMTVGRQKDEIDVLSLLLDRRKDVDLSLLSKKVEAAGLTAHLLRRVREYARKMKDGTLEGNWLSVTASRLGHVEKREIVRFLARLADSLREA